MQKYVAVGRLTSDPKLSYSGQKVRCEFTLAVSTRKGTFRKTDFIPCVVWHSYAESVANYARKGQRIGIVGEWRTHPYNDGENNKVRYEVEVESVDYYDVPHSNKSD